MVDCRQDLVKRQTAIKNWIGSLLHHETWEDRRNLWSSKGQARLRAMKLPAGDRMLVKLKVEQLELLSRQLEEVEACMQEVYDGWPEAQWVDRIRGIGMGVISGTGEFHQPGRGLEDAQHAPRGEHP